MTTVQPIPSSTPQGSKALDFTMGRFLAITAELSQAREQLAAVRALVDHARKVSPSRTVTLYVVDVEIALGLTDQAAPHKLGMSE